MKTKTITFLFLAALFGVSALFGHQNEMQGRPMQGCGAKRCSMKEGSYDSKMMNQKSDMMDQTSDEMSTPNQVSAGTDANKDMSKDMDKDMSMTTDMDMDDEDEDNTEDKNKDKNT